MKLPHKRSNLLIEGKLLAGDWPTRDTFEKLLDFGVNSFVNVANMERGGNRQYKYWYKLPKDVEYHNYPFSSTSDIDMEEVEECVNEIIREIVDDKLVYLHCVGGHGRTGMIGAIVVGIFYDMKANEAIRYVENAREMRKDTSRNYIPTPETNLQVDAIIDYLGLEENEERIDRSDLSWKHI